MKGVILVLAGLSAIAGCSDTRDQRIATIDSSAQRPDLTLPDTTSRRDTSRLMSSRGEQPVSPVEQQQVARAEPTPAKPQAAPKRKPRPQPPAAAVDTSTRAYAPDAVADTAVAPDTVPPDTAYTAVARDTVSAPPSATATRNADTISKADTTSRTDSSVAAPRDTGATRVGDTSTTVASDTTSPAAASTAVPSTATAAAARTLPVGTEIHAALDDSISSRSDTVGQTISAHVMDNVVGPDGRTLIAAGAPVRFTIVRLRASKSKNSQGRLALRADGIALNGELRPVQANVQPISRELRGRGVTGSEAAKVGGGAAAGAVLGRVIGGNTKGTVIGGVAGAAAGAVVAGQTATRDVVVKAKTPVVFVLTAPLVTP
jgi:glycine zipper 2TM protein